MKVFISWWTGEGKHTVQSGARKQWSNPKRAALSSVCFLRCHVVGAGDEIDVIESLRLMRDIARASPSN
ncbi:hypothetical protein Agabi119p4_7158 [Agaricus bisporus var. burnettii]|uniref:Uncharacterized protein n=1 Tax=Agaricus bisporus var. burnettii TaxID=192524 RepID=A0A8H7EZ82_AGABI|nr:hypothetical protein Agabi119p4_7158 [Agaricus bisporus var. burnettii]